MQPARGVQEMFHYRIPFLVARRYRVVRIDQRGFGLSGPVAKNYPLTTELYVDDLARVTLDFLARRS